MVDSISNILPINVVGVVSGTLASGTPTDIFSLAAIRNVVIVNQDAIPVNIVGGTDRSIGIFTFDSVPDATGSVFLEPYDVKATNDVWKRLVLVFNDTATRIGFRGGFSIPADYSSGGEIVVTWTSTATSGATEWDFDYRVVSVGDSFDQLGVFESLNTSGTAPSSTDERVDTILTLTSGVSANDEIEFELFRDGTDGGDDMAAAALVFRGMFRYTGG